MLEIYDLKTEYRRSPLGIDLKNPRFSWKLKSPENDTVQTSYRLTVTHEADEAWDSGRVEAEQSVHVAYAGKLLAPATRYTVRVEAADNHGGTASAESWFETGLMHHSNFEADWITHGFEDDLQPCAVFAKTFSAPKKVKSARVYASALGVYELALNGQKVGDALLAPGWTSYKKRIQYQTYDITGMLRANNRIEMTVGNGWYKGVLGFYGQGNHYGPRTAAIAQIVIRYVDGTTDIHCTDESWESTTGPHRYSDLYGGEVIDHSFVPETPVPARRYAHPKDMLVGQESEPVRITQRLPAQKLILTPKGEVMLDFGQNIAGVVEARICRPKGTVITVRHAEALDQDGNFYTENLRTAKATDTFVCSGGDDVFRPAFTFHGFRYIQLEGLGDSPNLADFTACVIHSDLEQTGRFECDNDDVNQLWRNIDWTMRGNYLDVPMDCPQRDERLGYTGDAQIFIATAAVHKDIAAFYQKWLRDLAAEQTQEYGVPMAVPNILGDSSGIAIWHDAATVIPWTLWNTYGDKRFLEEQYESMKGCVEYTRGNAGGNGLLQTGQQLGDWVALDMEKGPMRPRTDEVLNLTPKEKSGATDAYFIANAYYANSTRILAESAKILGHAEDAREYDRLYNTILDAIRAEYITPAGRLVSETQTGCALALRFGLAEEKDRPRIFETLLNNVREHRNHLTTGFAGTQFLCNVLTEGGAHDTAGSLFLQEDCPSWLYSVKLGGTTVWELWDGVNPDGSFNKYEMNSLNQYALASIGDWMHRKLGGLDLLEPGYKKSLIAPRLIKGIPGMKTSIETVYGELACAITCKDKKFAVDIRVPANTTAVVRLPEREEMTVGSGVYHYEYATESSFDKERYSQDSTLGELLENPLGAQLFKQYAAELLENEMFIQFASVRPILDIAAVVPPEMMQLMDMVIVQLNEQERLGEMK